MGNLFNKLIITLLVLPLFCCKTKYKDIEDNSEIITPIKTEKRKDLIIKKSLDVLDVDSLTIRGFKIKININEFKSIWKNSDSIKTYIADCGPLEGEKIKEFYHKGLMFELFGESANLREVDFTKNNNELKHPKIILNVGTYITDIKKFNNSYYNKKEYHKENDKYTEVEFLTKKGWDDRIVLVFKNGTLIDLYFSNLPC